MPDPSQRPTIDSRASSALEHPLPAGMRDLLPAEARALSELGRDLLECFELHGYQRVTMPAFEYAEVLERGLGSLDPREVLRFVEPESGEVVALRPDMTPQIARLVATRLRSAPGPARLSYEGSVVRLRRERARRHRQIPQAGIELIGCPAPEGDEEVLAVVTAALRAAALPDFVLDLSHARIAGALLERVPPESRGALTDALTAKDGVELGARARDAGLDPALGRVLVELSELQGGAEIWPRAERCLAGTPAAPAFAELRRVWEAVSSAGLAPAVSVDLGEVRDLDYYTGVTFQILAEGPGEAVAAGGRYDGLLGKFGAPRPAAGFAVMLDNLLWALGDSTLRSRPRVLVAAERARAEPILAVLRACGVAAASVGELPLEHAAAWAYSHVAELAAPSPALLDPSTQARTALSGRSPAELGQEIARLVTSNRSTS